MPELTWFQTGNDPERHELVEDLHPLNDAMTLNHVGYVERERSGHYRGETYTALHQSGSQTSLGEAKARVDYYHDPGE